MPAPIMKRSGESSHSIQGQLPFANDNVDEADFDAENAGSLKSDTAARHRKRSPSITSGTFLSSSYTGRTPARSFFHHASHGAAGKLLMLKQVQIGQFAKREYRCTAVFVRRRAREDTRARRLSSC